MADRKPPATQILSGDDGTILLVRGQTVAEVIDTAHGEAAGDGYVLTAPEAVVLEWIRAVPCANRSSGGHEFDGAGGWCDGGMRCHYIGAQPGPGAFRGAFIDLTYEGHLEGDDPRMARYLTEIAEMEARANG